MDQLLELSQIIKESSYTVVLTGAGMSTESGVPDFRSKTGWWRQTDPRTVATVDTLEENYSLFHEFYSMRIESLQNCQPHQGHYLLAGWEKRGLIHEIATQNVDGFHQLAGNNYVHELHGSIRKIRCHSCNYPATQDEFLDKNPCVQCNGKLRPEIVLFGEGLPENAWHKALIAIQKADLVIVIGTSLQVYPVNQLPSMTRGQTVFINMDPSDIDHEFDLAIYGKAGEVLLKTHELV